MGMASAPLYVRSRVDEQMVGRWVVERAAERVVRWVALLAAKTAVWMGEPRAILSAESWAMLWAAA